MTDPLLPADPPDPPDPPSPPPTRAERPSKITCDFCRCVLVASNGDVFKMSDEAKAFRDSADKIETLVANVDTLQEKLNIVTRERDDAIAARTTKRTGIFAS